MGIISHRCCICMADFDPGVLDKEGKCPTCRMQYPTVKTRQEAFALNQPELHLGAKLTEERVRQIAREEFNVIRAEIKAKAEAMKVATVPVVIPATVPAVVPIIVSTISTIPGITETVITNQETTNV